ncbi:hypothetical protein [Rubinisphaera sp.]|uniref:hypothetical protein n=1 Tax=Rubinisphaera sp. TaxID=2024857 RepID=UPI000C0E08E9|nr:hypothetical protein [Rubinisphaera sp.]MBV08365.1 hypothetical protein [Rubinisphaera sp.]|tara:strand:- start:922 stop:1404 length:483 start_codon:yes stop_codon:yes gene_type:complete
MAVKKQPDPQSGTLHECANDWFRQFLKHLEIFLVETGQGLSSDSDTADYSLAAMQAVKLTLLDSGHNHEQILALFGRVAFEDADISKTPEWTTEKNRRRFELIDGDIQGTLSQNEQLELAGLTQLMRQHVDSEANMPVAGARKLHRYLTGLDSESTDSEP